VTFELRRVVTRVEGDGAVFASDGPPPNTVSAPTGFGVAEVLWLDGWPQTVDDGGDRTTPGYPLEPPPGGLSSRIIRMPAGGDWLRVEGDDPDAPGMHATDTLDLMVVLDGEITLGLPDRELTVSAGHAVVQQGTKHRWKVSGDQPCTYWVTMLRPQPGTDPGLSVVGGDSPVRRVVTGALVDDHAPVGIGGGGTTMVDVWHTGGKVASVAQGGDSSGPWQLEPLGGGVSLRWLEIPAGQESASMWHTTATIDVDVILSGRMALELPDGRVELGPGDVVVQRGTNHRWIPLETVQFAALMIAVP
jgi:mannose-6-phosphate isomerase-like protein (cupin superfamily)